jgi:hypothetical protein
MSVPSEPPTSPPKPPARKRRQSQKKKWKLSRRWIAGLALLAIAAALLTFTLRPDPLEDLETTLREKGYEPSVGLAGPPPGTILQVARKGADGRMQPIQPPQVVLWADQCFPGKTPRSAPFPLPGRMGSRKTDLDEAGALKLLPELSLSAAKSWEVSLTNPHLQTFAKLDLSQGFSEECLVQLEKAFDSGEDPAQYATVLEAVVVDGLSLLVEWQAGAEGKGKAAVGRAARSKEKIRVQASGEEKGKTRLDIQGPLILGYRMASMEAVGEKPQ